MSAQKGPKVPGHMKRCTYCEKVKPRTEEHFYLYRPSKGTKLYFFSRCIACGPVYFRDLRRRLLAEEPERVRAKEARYRERLKANPERHATRLAYSREWQRQHRGKGGRQRVDLPGVLRDHVPASPVRAAVLRSGVSLAQLAVRLERDPSGLRRALSAETLPGADASAVLLALGVLPAEVDL